MNRILLAVIGLLCFALVANGIDGLLERDAHASVKQHRSPLVDNLARCGSGGGHPQLGASIALTTTTGVDDDSGALALDTCWRLWCEDDVWVDFGAAAVTATAGDMPYDVDSGASEYRPAFWFTTGGDDAIAHVSVLTMLASPVDCYLTAFE